MKSPFGDDDRSFFRDLYKSGEWLSNLVFFWIFFKKPNKQLMKLVVYHLIFVFLHIWWIAHGCLLLQAKIGYERILNSQHATFYYYELSFSSREWKKIYKWYDLLYFFNFSNKSYYCYCIATAQGEIWCLFEESRWFLA